MEEFFSSVGLCRHVGVEDDGDVSTATVLSFAKVIGVFNIVLMKDSKHGCRNVGTTNKDS